MQTTSGMRGLNNLEVSGVIDTNRDLGLSSGAKHPGSAILMRTYSGPGIASKSYSECLECLDSAGG